MVDIDVHIAILEDIVWLSICMKKCVIYNSDSISVSQYLFALCNNRVAWRNYIQHTLNCISSNVFNLPKSMFVIMVCIIIDLISDHKV